ncbi:MAG: hypothetical protein E6Q32_11025 [Neisseriales bacterium]|nr:MAG: hypothetical protein E6Q32_11025 [Neisseriales bacterium]
MKTFYKVLIAASSAIGIVALSACSNGSKSGSGGTNTIPQQPQQVNATIGQMSVIPLLSSNQLVTNRINGKSTVTSSVTSSGSYKLAITNNKSLPMLIDSISVTGNGASDKNATNGSCGNQVQGNNSCYLSITPPDHAGSFVLTVYYHYTDGKSGKLAQLIQYGAVTANNGYYYQNNNSRVITAIDQTRVLSFPIILAEDYTKLTTSSNFNSSVDCGGGSYSKGTVCTLIVEAKGGITDNVATVNLRGTLPNGQQNQLTLNTLVTVTSSPNLIIGGTGIIINPANGADANQVEVTMFNAGNTDATSLVITPAAPLTTSLVESGETTCATTLAASASCIFKVNAESIISGQNTVTVTDAEGDSQSINVFYVAESASPALTITPSGSLLNTIAGYESQAVTLTLTNSSTSGTSLTNLTLPSMTLQNSYLSYVAYTGIGDACRNAANPSGVITLAAGASCSVVINYNPAFAAGGQSGNLVFTPVANYIDVDNISKTYSQATLSMGYSSTTPVVTIVMTTPASNSQNNPFAFNILPNGIDFESQVFTFTNTGNIPATDISFNNVISGYPSLSSLNITASSDVANPCVNLATLNQGASCSMVLTFGPVSAEQALESVGLQFSATNAVTSAVVGVNYYISAEADDAKLSLAAIAYSTDGNTWTTIESTTDLGGRSTDPLSFDNYQAYPIYLKYSYLSNGNESALNFNVNLNNIPAPYGIVSGQTTCPYGANVATLNIGSSCDVVLKAVDYSKSAIYANGYGNGVGAIDGSLNISVPAVSYTSSNTGVHKNLVLSYAPTSDTMTYVTAVNFFSNVWQITVTGGPNNGGGDWIVNINSGTFVVYGIESNPIVNLNYANWGSAFESYTSTGDCSPAANLDINPNNWNIPLIGSCRSLSITVPNYTPQAKYTFPYTVTSGYDPTTSYSSTLSFTLD